MLVQDDAAGFEDDLDEYFRTLSPWLRGTLSRRFGLARADAEDLVQESFIRLGRYGAKDRSQHPHALLLKIATNLTRDARRRLFTRQTHQHVGLDTLTRSLPPHLIEPDHQAFLIDLKAAILGLPEPLRETFLLARFTPLTHDAIAKRLGISTKTVEWRISKAVAICLAQLEHRDG